MAIRQGKGPTSVCQPWAFGLSFMQQSVLLTAVRGPDGLPKYGAVKMLLRWYRRCLLISSMDGNVLDTPSALGGGSFMGPSYDTHYVEVSNGTGWCTNMDRVLSDYLKDLDAIPHHFQLHLLHSFEIMGYKHPHPYKRAWFHSAYERLVCDMHLNPETEEELDYRLGDDREQWLSTADKATAR